MRLQAVSRESQDHNPAPSHCNPNNSNANDPPLSDTLMKLCVPVSKERALPFHLMLSSFCYDHWHVSALLCVACFDFAISFNYAVFHIPS